MYCGMKKCSISSIHPGMVSRKLISMLNNSTMMNGPVREVFLIKNHLFKTVAPNPKPPFPERSGYIGI